MLEKAELMEAMEQKVGPQVIDVVKDYYRRRTLEAWQEKAKNEGSNTIDDIMRLLWQRLEPHGFEYTVEEKGSEVQLRVTKCKVYDIARELGVTKWAYYFHCANDPFIVQGFNPEIGFKRS
jgi:predicted ArsR family transcriptional regulator